jgi:hypothetical protein
MNTLKNTLNVAEDQFNNEAAKKYFDTCVSANEEYITECGLTIAEYLDVDLTESDPYLNAVFAHVYGKSLDGIQNDLEDPADIEFYIITIRDYIFENYDYEVQ